MIRVLVTGASGQLGMAISALAGEYPQLTFHFAGRSDLDITDRDSINIIFEKKGYDYCINCAAYTDVEQAEKTPEKAFEINEQGAANLAETCKAHEVILIHISTDYVFDGKKAEGYLPSDLPNPINQYGRSKWEGEKRVQEILNKYFIIRTSWLYSERGTNFYTKILNRAQEGGKISVTAQQMGCPTHADNLGRYILDLIASENKTFGIHHFTDGEAMTWYGFAKRILAEQGYAESITVEEAKDYPTSVKRPKNSVLLNETTS